MKKLLIVAAIVGLAACDGKKEEPKTLPEQNNVATEAVQQVKTDVKETKEVVKADAVKAKEAVKTSVANTKTAVSNTYTNTKTTVKEAVK